MLKGFLKFPEEGVFHVERITGKAQKKEMSMYRKQQTIYFPCRLSEGWKDKLCLVYGGAKQLGLNPVGYREPCMFSEEHYD